MFKNIFDLSYERNITESVVFYFCYVIFAIYLWVLAICILFYFIQDEWLRNILIMLLTPWVPLIFYILITILLCIKKNYKDRHNLIFVVSTILLTFVIPSITGILLSMVTSPSAPNLTLDVIIGGTFGGIFLFFIAEIFFGAIPLAILSTRECLKDQKIMQKMDQERIKKEKQVEKLLLFEQMFSKEPKKGSDNI